MDCGLRPAWGKKLARLPSQPIASYGGMLLPCQATWDVEFGRIGVPGYPGQNMFVRPHPDGKKLSVMTHTCHPNYGGKHK
jgi:hypothetical protein